ncbi:hypothetical protein [Clostridium sp.]|uniref:hypothetical protein n=1 Tax=Clostridium sp. TaxID=1506 RepID=UPI003217FC08
MSVLLVLMPNSLNATTLTVQRATSSSGPWTNLATVPSSTNLYTDQVGNINITYYYRAFASNTVILLASQV